MQPETNLELIFFICYCKIKFSDTSWKVFQRFSDLTHQASWSPKNQDEQSLGGDIPRLYSELSQEGAVGIQGVKDRGINGNIDIDIHIHIQWSLTTFGGLWLSFPTQFSYSEQLIDFLIGMVST